MRWIQTRIVNLIHKIQFNSVKSQLKFWASEGGSDLFFGAFLVAKYHFPNLSYNLLNEMMNIIRRDIQFEINDQQSTLEKSERLIVSFSDNIDSNAIQPIFSTLIIA